MVARHFAEFDEFLRNLSSLIPASAAHLQHPRWLAHQIVTERGQFDCNPVPFDFELQRRGRSGSSVTAFTPLTSRIVKLLPRPSRKNHKNVAALRREKGINSCLARFRLARKLR